MDKLSIYVVSDDGAVHDSISAVLESAGLRAQLFDSLQSLYQRDKPQIPSCLVLDTHNYDFTQHGQRAALEAACNVTPVILITDRGDVAAAVEGMKLGASDVVQKPYRENRLLDAISQVMASGFNRD